MPKLKDILIELTMRAAARATARQDAADTTFDLSDDAEIHDGCWTYNDNDVNSFRIVPREGAA